MGKLCKIFPNDSSANINLSKTQLHKNSAIRKIYRDTSWVITKNQLGFNEKCC